jgi:hypothetical protein
MTKSNKHKTNSNETMRQQQDILYNNPYTTT